MADGNVERIDSIYDIASITGEHEQLQKLLQQDSEAIVQVYSNLEQFQGKSNVGTVAMNWDKVSVAMTGAANASDALLQIQDKLNSVIAANADLEKRLADALAASTKAKQNKTAKTDDEIRSTYEASKATKDHTKEVISQTDAYKALELQRDRQAAKAKTLQATALQTGNPADITAANQASAQANSLTNALKRIDQSVGESRRKVGDYTGALKILEDELASVNAQISNIRNTGQDFGNVLPKLTAESEALSTVIGVQSKGFSSVTMQIRASERALQTLRAAGLEGTAVFEKLQQSTANAAREQHNFNEQQKILEDNVPVLKTITIAAKGLAASYAIGQGTVALFSDGNEKLEKELNKLVAVMTILQGLQEVHELLEKSGAIGTEARVAITNALNFALQRNTAAELAAAEARVAAARASLAAAEGEEAQTVAVTELTMAEGALTIATEETTAAFVGWQLALGGLGLLAIIGLVATAVVFLINKMKDWTAETTLDVKEQQALTEAMGEEYNMLQKISDLFDKSSKQRKQQLEDELSLETKQGKNAYELFAIREKLAAQNVDVADSKKYQATAQAENTYAGQGLTGEAALQKARKDALEKLTDASYKQSVVQTEVGNTIGLSEADRRAKDISSKDIENMKERLEFAKAATEQAQKQFDFYDKADEDATKAHAEQEDLRAEKTKFSFDEQRKYKIASLKLQTDAIKKANEDILNDPRSNLSERVGAIRSNADQDTKVVAQSSRNNEADFKAGRITKTDYMQTRQANAAQLLQISKDEAKQERDIQYEYYSKDRDAQTEIFTLEQQDRQKQAEKILDDDKSTFAERQKAQADFYDAQRTIIGANMLKELDQLGLTNTQRLKIMQEYDSNIKRNTLDRIAAEDAEQKKEKQKQLDQAKQFYDNQAANQGGVQALASSKLSKQYINGQISGTAYDRQKAEQEYNDQVANAQQNVTRTAGIAKVAPQADQAKANEDAKQAQAVLDDIIAQHKKSTADAEKKMLIDSAMDTQKSIQSIQDSAYELQMQRIEKLIAREERYKDAQINRINASTLGEQQKAAAIANITRESAMQTEALQKREAQIKVRQAKFDRDAAVAEAIEQGAIAALAALKIPVYGEVEAIAIGLITAAKVAEILARPLPTYGYGSDGPTHPGGLALVGDRFHAEGIIEPGGKAYMSPAVPTILDLPAHTQVISHEDLQRMQNENMFVDNRGVLITAPKRDGNKQLLAAMANQTYRLEKAIKGQKKTTVVNVQQSDSWFNYIKKNVRT